MSATLNSLLQCKFDIRKIDFFVCVFLERTCNEGRSEFIGTIYEGNGMRKKSGIFKTNSPEKETMIVLQLLHFLKIMEAREASHILKR